MRRGHLFPPEALFFSRGSLTLPLRVSRGSPTGRVQLRAEIPLPVEPVAESLIPVPGFAHPKDETPQAAFEPSEPFRGGHRIDTRQHPSYPLRIPVAPPLNPEHDSDPAIGVLHPNPGA